MSRFGAEGVQRNRVRHLMETTPLAAPARTRAPRRAGVVLALLGAAALAFVARESGGASPAAALDAAPVLGDDAGAAGGAPLVGDDAAPLAAAADDDGAAAAAGASAVRAVTCGSHAAMKLSCDVNLTIASGALNGSAGVLSVRYAPAADDDDVTGARALWSDVVAVDATATGLSVELFRLRPNTAYELSAYVPPETRARARARRG